jgi:hypothetical protein
MEASLRKRGIKHNDLTHYFLRPHSELPRAYLASCEKFFKSLKRQAPSSKLQAPRPAQPEVEKK